MRKPVGVAFKSIMCGILVARDVEFKKPWCVSLALKSLRNAPCTEYNVLQIEGTVIMTNVFVDTMFLFAFLP